LHSFEFITAQQGQILNNFEEKIGLQPSSIRKKR